MSHKRKKAEEKQVNFKMVVPKFQSSLTKEEFTTIAQEYTNKKIYLREKDERIEKNETCLKSL